MELTQKARNELNSALAKLSFAELEFNTYKRDTTPSKDLTVNWYITKYLHHIDDLFCSFELLFISSENTDNSHLHYLAYASICRSMWERLIKIQFLSIYLIKNIQNNNIFTYDEIAKLIAYDECIFFAKSYTNSKNKKFKESYDNLIIKIFNTPIDINEFQQDGKRNEIISKNKLLVSFSTIAKKIKFINQNNHTKFENSKGMKFNINKIELMKYNSLSGSDHGTVEGSTEIKFLGEKGIIQKMICEIAYESAIETKKYFNLTKI